MYILTKSHLHVHQRHVGVEGGGCVEVGGDELLEGQGDGGLVFDPLVDVVEHLEDLRVVWGVLWDVYASTLFLVGASGLCR